MSGSNLKQRLSSHFYQQLMMNFYFADPLSKRNIYPTICGIWLQGPDFSSPDFGFEERFEFPGPSFFSELNLLPDSLQSRRVIQPFAANYIRSQPFGQLDGQVSIAFEFDRSEIGVGAVAYFKNGSTELVTRNASGGGRHVLNTTWDWEDIDQIALSVVNTGRSTGLTYNLFIDSTIPDKFELAQNFPNPF